MKRSITKYSHPGILDTSAPSLKMPGCIILLVGFVGFAFVSLLVGLSAFGSTSYETSTYSGIVINELYGLINPAFYTLLPAFLLFNLLFFNVSILILKKLGILIIILEILVILGLPTVIVLPTFNNYMAHWKVLLRVVNGFPNQKYFRHNNGLGADVEAYIYFDSPYQRMGDLKKEINKRTEIANQEMRKIPSRFYWEIYFDAIKKPARGIYVNQIDGYIIDKNTTLWISTMWPNR